MFNSTLLYYRSRRGSKENLLKEGEVEKGDHGEEIAGGEEVGREGGEQISYTISITVSLR